jgi:hypothetical protein
MTGSPLRIVGPRDDDGSVTGWEGISIVVGRCEKWCKAASEYPDERYRLPIRYDGGRVWSKRAWIQEWYETICRVRFMPLAKGSSLPIEGDA